MLKDVEEKKHINNKRYQ